MNANPSATEVRAFVLESIAEPLTALGLTAASVPHDFDLLREGVLDSLGFVELTIALEDHFGLQIDFEQLDPEQLGALELLSRHVAASDGRVD